MSIVPPSPGEPRRPLGPRDPGDAWVVTSNGERYWGRFGAAGLLAVDAERGVLLQHRVSWSHHGDTWGLPGGARHEGESACDGALREAAEEAGVPRSAVRPRVLSVFDVGYWSYTTVVGDVVEPFEPTISDPESHELAWVPVDEVTDYPLHPGFAASWERLRGLLEVRPAVIVDVANVMGAVPDGWWRDRPRAASRIVARISELAARGVPSSALDLPEHTWYPEWIAVVEGQARRADGAAGVDMVRAEASGDDAIVAVTREELAAARAVIVVTSDRGLSEQVALPAPPPRGAGMPYGTSGHAGSAATVRGARWLLDLLED